MELSSRGRFIVHFIEQMKTFCARCLYSYLPWSLAVFVSQRILQRNFTRSFFIHIKLSWYFGKKSNKWFSWNWCSHTLLHRIFESSEAMKFSLNLSVLSFFVLPRTGGGGWFNPLHKIQSMQFMNSHITKFGRNVDQLNI